MNIPDNRPFQLQTCGRLGARSVLMRNFGHIELSAAIAASGLPSQKSVAIGDPRHPTKAIQPALPVAGCLVGHGR
jgi:hypothetical protein